MLALFHSFNKLGLQVLSTCLESLTITPTILFEIKRNTYINMISIIINCGQKSFIEYFEVIKSNTQGLYDKFYHAGSYLIPYYSCIIYDMIIFRNSTRYD